MTLDGEAVDKGDLAAGRMPGVGPVAGFHEHGAEQANLDDLSADTFNLDPIAYANAISPHEHKPAEEGDDEILESDGESGAGEQEGFDRMTRKDQMPVDKALALLARERLSGEPVPEGAQRILSMWRETLGENADAALTEMTAAPEQCASSRATLSIIAMLPMQNAPPWK